MSLQETVTYNVNITLSTEQGECPTRAQGERLILDQMSGVLDDETGLICIGVDVFGVMPDA